MTFCRKAGCFLQGPAGTLALDAMERQARWMEAQPAGGCPAVFYRLSLLTVKGHTLGRLRDGASVKKRSATDARKEANANEEDQPTQAGAEAAATTRR